MKNSNGFTLIELMIVIAILSIVTAIAIPAYDGYIQGARLTEAKNNIAALILAEEEYFLEKNQYCYDDSDDNANLSNACDNLWTASKGDGGTVNFIYTVSGAGTSYTITATGIAGSKAEGLSDSHSN